MAVQYTEEQLNNFDKNTLVQLFLSQQNQLEQLDNSLASPSVVAGIMNAKYVNALPLARIESEYQRNNLDISRQTMANWTIQCAERYLAVLYDYLHTRLPSITWISSSRPMTKDNRNKSKRIRKSHYKIRDNFTLGWSEIVPLFCVICKCFQRHL